MKKLLMFSAAAFALTSPAMAEESTDGKPHHQSFIEKFDTDKDGAISKAEFLAMHEQRFAEFDTNSDGKISKEESDAKKAEWKEKRKEMHGKKDAEGAPAAEAPADVPAETPPAQ
ncbi:MAG: EF-hand domain-containing protein [Alphaproteobacteria bacterium]